MSSAGNDGLNSGKPLLQTCTLLTSHRESFQKGEILTTLKQKDITFIPKPNKVGLHRDWRPINNSQLFA